MPLLYTFFYPYGLFSFGIPEQLQSIQARLPHSLDADILMANCAWEYVLIWNRDPEVVFLLQQAVAYLRCIQNAAIQHGKGCDIHVTCQATLKKKFVSCPAGGQNCGHSGGRNVFFLVRKKLQKNSKIKKKKVSPGTNIVTRQLDMKQTFFKGGLKYTKRM